MYLPNHLKAQYERTMQWQPHTSRLKPRRGLITGLLLIAIIGTGVLYFFSRPGSVSAAWFDDSWGYRQTVAITNAGSAQTDYQVAITLDTAALITAGKMQSDCDDIRITDIGGNVLPIWIETGTNACNTTTTAIWTKVPSISTTGATVYLYYGNPSAVSVQNGNNVFIFFDDFSGSSIDSTKWTVHYGAPVVSNGLINFRGGVANDGITSIAMALLGTGNYSMEARHRINSGSNTWNFGFSDAFDGTEPNADDVNFQLCTTCSNTSWIFRDYSDAIYSTQTKDTEGLWRITKMSYIQNTNGIATTYSDDRASTLKTYTTTTSLPTMSLFDRIHFISHTKDADMDWVFIHKNAATLPSVASPASEEKSLGPVAYWKFDEGYGANTNDYTSNNNDGTITGATWSPEDQCISGKCLQFANTFINTNYTSVSNATPLSQAGDLSVSSWFKANTQPTANSSYKVLVIQQGGSGTNLKDQYTAAGYNVVVDTAVTTVGQVAAYSPDIVLCDQYAWGCGGTLLNSLYDAGYNVVTKGNDTSTAIYPIATDHGGTHSNTTIAPDEKHPLGNGWASTGNSGTDTGRIIDTIHASAISIAKNGAGFTEIIYLEQPNKGRWFHYQAYGTLNATLFTNLNSFILRYNIIGKGKNYNLFTYNGSLYGYVNNQKLSGTMSYNSWNHASLVYDKTGGNIYLYLNGKQLATAAYSTALDTDSLNISLGSLMKGFIDDVKVYPYARTAAQIKSDFASKGSGSVKGTAVSMGSNSKNSDALSNGLVGYWKMEETATPSIDSSGNNLSGTWTGNTTYNTGKFGNSTSYDGTGDYDEVTGLTIGNTTTFAAWIKTSAYDGKIPLSLNSDTYSSGPNLYFAGGKINWNTGDSANNPFYTGSFPDANWHHFVVVNDPITNLATLYIDGVSVGTAAYRNPTTTNSNFRIGDYHGGGYSLNGQMDEVRLYNRALSGKEVRDLYAWAPGPVGYWNFEEGTGGTVNDTSGNSGTGTWYGTGNHWTQGKFGKSGQFNSTDNYVNVGSGSPLQLSKTGTVCLWFKPLTAFSGSIGAQKHLMGGGPRSFYFSASSSILYYFLSDNATGIGSNASSWDTNWHYVCTTSDGTTLKMYIDGVQQTATVSLGANNYFGNLSAVTIGTGSTSFTGNIDDVKIYNYARTSGQITEDMNAGHPLGGSPVGSQVGYWKFDEGYGITANNSGSGGSAINGTLTGATSLPTWSNSGKFSKAVNFDGIDDYVDVSDNNSIDMGAGDYTISTWFKTSNPTTLQMIINHRTSDEWLVGISGSKISAYLYDGGTTHTQTINGLTTIQANTWYHLSVTFSRTGNATIYLNGKVDGSGSITGVPESIAPTGFLRIGYNSTGASGAWAAAYFNGLIDEVKIYNAALTADEIKLDYNHGSAMVLGDSVADNSDNPVGYWKLDENSGTTVNNSGSCSNCNGTSASITYTSGKINGSYDMQPSVSDYWYVPANATLDVDSKFTIETWGTYDTAGRYGLFANNTLENQFNAYVSGTTVGILGLSLSGGTVQSGQWFHTAVTYDGTTYRLYVNGVQVATDAVSGARDFSGCWVFGQEVDGAGLCTSGFDAAQAWDGKTDEVKIYNYARSASQIKADAATDVLNPSLPGAPVGEWNFEEGSGGSANDTSSNNTVSTWAGTGSHWTTGKVGKAGNFNGSDDKVVASSGLYALTSAVTLQAWIYPTTVTGVHDIISNNNVWDYRIYQNGTNLTMQVALDDGNTGYHTANGVLTLNTWQHIAGVFDGSTVKIYLNGRQVLSEAAVGTIQTPGSGIVIGSYGSGEYFLGKIDQARIYSYARTPAQIAYDYNRGAPVGHWKFDECQGITANDSSGNGNSGTITIGATGTNTSVGTCTGSAGEAWKDGAIGKYNSSLEFDGTDDYVTTSDPTNNILDPNYISVSAWVKAATINHQSSIVNKQGSSSDRGYIVYTESNNYPKFAISTTGSDVNTATGITALTTGSWYHLVGTYDGSNVKIYVNGTLENTQPKVGTIYNSTDGVEIGWIPGWASGYVFNGQIDDVKIFNYALTSAQIKQVYNEGSSVRFGPVTGSP